MTLFATVLYYEGTEQALRQAQKITENKIYLSYWLRTCVNGEWNVENIPTEADDCLSYTTSNPYYASINKTLRE